MFFVTSHDLHPPTTKSTLFRQKSIFLKMGYFLISWNTYSSCKNKVLQRDKARFRQLKRFLERLHVAHQSKHDVTVNQYQILFSSKCFLLNVTGISYTKIMFSMSCASPSWNSKTADSVYRKKRFFASQPCWR